MHSEYILQNKFEPQNSWNFEPQNSWNLLDERPILPRYILFTIILIYFGGQNIWVNNRQQAPHTWIIARPRAKLYVTMKHDFKRYDASIKDIPCHSLFLWILQYLPCRLGRLKSGTALTPSHHYPTMKHT
jgi:hypothetical protein